MIILTNYGIAAREYLPNQYAISNTQPSWWKGSGTIPELFPGDIVWKYKRGQLTEIQYTTVYMNQLVALDRYGFDWSKLEGKTLLCWCTEGNFCHRRLLASFLKTKGFKITLR